MKFKFPFETLIKQRRAIKDQAERDFRLALSKVDEQRMNLQSMRHQLSDAVDEIQRARQNGGKLVGALESLATFVSGQKIRIQNQLRVVRGLEEISEQKRLILVEALKDLKVLEKLKEKRYNDFKKAVRKKEAKNIDEVSVMRAARGVGE